MVRKMQFKAIDGSRVSNDAAQRSGEIFYALATERQAVTAEDFLERARAEPTDSPLLPYYDNWDVKTSARERWLEQSRLLMRSFEVITVVEGETVMARGAYYVPDAGGYLPTVTKGAVRSLAESKEHTISLARYAASAAISYYRRYSSILRLVGDEDVMTRKVQKLLRAIEEEFQDKM
jgi:hypothetical protein